MESPPLIDVWEMAPGSDLTAVVEAVLASPGPSFRALVLSTSSEQMKIHVAEGGTPSRRANTLFYVAHHGVYEIARESVSSAPHAPLVLRVSPLAR
jgi:hypothetical protein